MDWYYEKDGNQYGPVVESELSRLVQTGEIAASTSVWREGMNQWTPLGSAAPHLVQSSPATPGLPVASPVAAKSPYQDPNPYQSPQNFGGGYTPPASLPGFAKGFLITDLVLCSLRALMVIGGVVGMAVIEKSDPIYQTAIFEIITGTVIAVFGIPAAILLLNRKGFGIPLAWIAMAGTVASMFVGVWQLTLTEPPQPQMAGAMYLGGGLAFIVRLGILACYCRAVLMTTKLINAR